MPILIAHGFPNLLQGGIVLDALRDLKEITLPQAVAGITALGIDPSDVLVFTPMDLIGQSKTQIMVFVVGLFAKPERDLEVQNRLTAIITETIEAFADKHLAFGEIHVEAFVHPFDPMMHGYSPGRIMPPSQKSPAKDAPFCDLCGHISIRSGNAWKCLNCGNTIAMPHGY